MKHRNVAAGIAYFVLVFGTGFVLGAMRVTLVVPRLGQRWAELLEMPLMLGACILAARWVTTRFDVTTGLAARVVMGTVALACLLTAELGIALALNGGSLQNYVASRDPVSGSVYLVMLLVFAALPAILARWQRPR